MIAACFTFSVLRVITPCSKFLLGNVDAWISSLQNRRNFLRISGEQRRKRGERVARAKRKLRARGGSLKNPAYLYTSTIVQAVPAFKYERGYLIGYFETRDSRMFRITYST